MHCGLNSPIPCALWLGRPHLIWATPPHLQTTKPDVVYCGSDNPISRGARAFVQQQRHSMWRPFIQRSPANAEATNLDSKVGAITATFERDAGEPAQTGQKPTAKELMHRMIGIQGTPFKCVSVSCATTLHPHICS
jgi:hypothetical protein